MASNQVDPIREQILAAIETHFKAQQAGLPGPDPYSFAWSLVDRASIDEISHGKRYTLAVIDGADTIVPGVSTLDGVTTKTLRVACEFKAMLEAKDRPSTQGNRIVGEIIRRMLEDDTHGSLAISTREAGSELFIENQNDRQIEGTVFFDILYRHSRRDPRKDAC